MKSNHMLRHLQGGGISKTDDEDTFGRSRVKQIAGAKT